MGASLVAAAASFVAALLIAALAHLLAVWLRDAESSWDLTWASGTGILLVLVLSLAQGVGFGLSFLNTPLAIVAFLVVPTVWSVLGSLIPGVHDVAPWLDLGESTSFMLEGQMPTGEEWGQLATSTLVWVVLPLLVGLWRVRTSEVK